jgi:hypothetical protein
VLKKILATIAFALVSASMAIPPTAAQASVEWHSNGVLLSTARQGTTFWGNWEVQNAFLGNIQCHVIGTLPVWNEGGLAKTEVDLIATGSCTSQPACSGVFMTAEAPVEAILRETTKREKVAEAKRGPFSLPWQGEGTEELEGSELVKRVVINGVKLTVVAPCDNAEIPFEGTLELNETNGSRNGLKPMHMEIVPIIKRPSVGGCLTSKLLPTEKEENSACLIGEVRDTGEGMQLITLE